MNTPGSADNRKVLKIGLVMAGAVSAGAYTAGVLDYLFEALEEWQRRKDEGIPNTPHHDLEIEVIGGASAGGMTGMITAAALQEKFPPVKAPDSPQGKANKFYDSWVNMDSEDILLDLLDSGDLKKDGLHSLLNSNFIDKIAQKVIEVPKEAAYINQRKYISPTLKFFVSLSNLKGWEYDIGFQAELENIKSFKMKTHEDYACYQLSEDGKAISDNGWIPLNFQKKININSARDAAMATGAFPLGLKARTFTRNINDIKKNSWLSSYFYDTTDSVEFSHIKEYSSLFVDGGMINNEPFEKVHQVLFGTHPDEEFVETSPSDFDRTIIMIDPFPSEPENLELEDDFVTQSLLKNIVPEILNVLLDQSRIKSRDLIEALNSENYSRFLIAPSRKTIIEEEIIPIEGSKALASGALGGFGGFLNKNFRIHDYFLGRKNCQGFLQNYFVIPADTPNGIVCEGYNGVDRSLFHPVNRKNSKGEDINEQFIQILPIFDKTRVVMPNLNPKGRNQYEKNWPVMTEKQLKKYEKPLKDRVKIILEETFNVDEMNFLDKILLKIGEKVILNRKITRAILNLTRQSLENNYTFERE